MAAKIDPYTTDAGLAAAIDARNNGLQLAITHVALGAGRYDSNTSGATKTALVAMRESVSIASGNVSGIGGFSCDVVFGEWAGTTYDATEIGFFAGDPKNGGKLIFVYSSPTDTIVQRNLLQFVASFVFQLARLPSDSIAITLDSQSSLAGQLLSNHEAKADPHTQYLKREGDTATGHLNLVTAPRLDRSKKAINAEFLAAQGFSYPSSGSIAVNGDYSAKVDQGNMFFDVLANNVSLTLPLSTGVLTGVTYTVRMSAPYGALRVVGTDTINTGDSLGSSKVVFMSRGEVLQLTRSASGVYTITGRGQPAQVGQIAYFPGRIIQPGWAELNGALLAREYYPLLWQFAQESGLVSEYDYGYNGYWGRFSVGTTGANFRLPDLRSTFIRSLDNGRNWYDGGREWGRYQESRNRWHGHGVNDPGHSHTGYTGWGGGHTHEVPDADSHEGWGVSFDSGNRQKLAHNIQTGYAGDHSHTIQTYGAGTGIWLSGEGGDDSRPTNLAYTAAIRTH